MIFERLNDEEIKKRLEKARRWLRDASYIAEDAIKWKKEAKSLEPIKEELKDYHESYTAKVIKHFQESIEFNVKAIFVMFGIEPPKIHSQKDLKKPKEKQEFEKNINLIERSLPTKEMKAEFDLALSYFDKWGRLHTEARYPNRKQTFTKENRESIEKDSEKCVKFALEIQDLLYKERTKRVRERGRKSKLKFKNKNYEN